MTLMCASCRQAINGKAIQIQEGHIKPLNREFIAEQNLYHFHSYCFAKQEEEHIA